MVSVAEQVSVSKRRWPLFVFAPVAMLLASAGNGEVNENLRYALYPVPLPPSQSLLQALDAASPIREHGRIFHGYTSWSVDWRFRWWQESNGQCRITSVTTTLSIVIQLPQLQLPASEPATLRRAEFEAYLAALRQHELGHADTGRMAAKAIDQAIAALPHQASCAELETKANETGYRLLAEFNQRDQQYDLATEHGRTQGAYLQRAEP